MAMNPESDILRRKRRASQSGNGIVRRWRIGVGTVRLGRRQTVAGNRFSGEMPRSSNRGSLLTVSGA